MVPAVVGEKVTVMVHDPPGLNWAHACVPLNWFALVPLMVTD